MFKLYLREAMIERGLKPTPATLKKMGVHHNRARQLLYGKNKELKLEELFSICMVLHCTPFELLKVEGQRVLPPHHPLLVWQQALPPARPLEVIKKLSPDKLVELNNFLAKLDKEE